MRIIRYIIILVLLLFQATYGRYHSQYSSFHGVNPKQNPQYIQMPSLNLLLPVEVAKVENDEWLLNDKKTAFYGEKSAHPGKPGVTVIFAHARQGYFALLPLLKPDNLIVLQTDNMVYYYQVEQKQVIDPTDVETLMGREDATKNVLAVFTCYGWQDSKLHYFFFDAVKIQVSAQKSIKNYIFRILLLLLKMKTSLVPTEIYREREYHAFCCGAKRYGDDSYYRYGTFPKA